MAESIYIKELNKGIRETAKGLREVTVKLTPLEEALPDDGGAEGYTPDYIHVRAQNGRPGALALVRLEALTEEGMAGTVAEYLP